MSLTQLLNKDVLMFLLEMKWKQMKKNFWKNGGFTNPKHLIVILWFFWAIWVFFRERGWLRKKSVRGKHIYITGAGSGLGRGMTLKFAKLGANISISDINEAGIKETKQMVKNLTGKDDNIFEMRVDISNRQAITDSAKACTQKFGNVDILINNAGIV